VRVFRAPAYRSPHRRWLPCANHKAGRHPSTSTTADLQPELGVITLRSARGRE
jgi:hypothetical protein